jgi:hypothetical protein
VIPVRQAITDTLASVADIGVVHAYERYAADHARLKTLYYSTPHGAIRGWFIRRVATREVGILVPRYIEEMDWQLRGYIALDDAGESELVADALVEAVRNKFRTNPRLSDTVQMQGPIGSRNKRGPQLVDFGPASFAGVLCHAVRFDMTTSLERTASTIER